ncbi:hypothetical protein K2Z83_09655 [Oscillochloris sp. ZM17-4]|uniref:hypothetical protein n=1 Tax=Oscillochloris sp. ZM17-4 TaxID=2866714 RepID=UPI001C733491|nr:hypothetical protein [Oscillochloris sp. ZM17-4]MBX0327939.1 hypothetical protein [Oscillochloris sp. ZM17-4]
MSLYIPEGIPPVIPNAMARIERRLPYPGEVLVREGSRVEPEDIVAQTLKPEPPQIINVARSLGIPPSQVYRAMRREVHNKVEAGQVLARAAGIVGRSCLAPVTGMIADIDDETGYVTIAPDPTEYAMQSTVRGIVMEVIPYEGVVIETPSAQVYGAFGIGEDRSGVLRLLATDPGDIVRPEQIDARSAYAILICGAGISAAALRRAVQEQVRGIIVGGIDESELRDFLGWADVGSWQVGRHTWQWPDLTATPDPKLTILVTEGFGSRPMNAAMFDLLSAQDRQEALIEGVTRLRRPLRRPRVVIPLTRSSSSVQVEAPRPTLRPGASVRLLDSDHLGKIAQVRSIPSSPRRVASRVSLAAVEVIDAEGVAFWLPRTCVEVLS